MNRPCWKRGGISRKNYEKRARSLGEENQSQSRGEDEPLKPQKRSRKSPDWGGRHPANMGPAKVKEEQQNLTDRHV